MSIDRIIRNIVRKSLLNEGGRRKETLDEYVDGKRLFDMLPEIHDMVKELARPEYGVRKQKVNLDKLNKFFMKNRNYFVKVAKKYNKIKESEGKGSFDIDDIIRLMYRYSGHIISNSNNQNNQLEGAEDFLTHYPEEIKEFDSSKKQDIEEYARTQGRESDNFFKNLIYEKDLDLVDIMSNIDFIIELQNKYYLRLLNLPIGW